MGTYRITIINDISNKKRRINIEAFSFKKAVMQAEWSINNPFENIIKAEIWKPKI